MEQDFLGLGNSGAVNSGNDEGGLVFDLDGVEEDKGFELIPKGKYPAIVDEVEFGESSTGNPMLTIKYKITEGEYEGRNLWDFIVLGGKALEFSLPKLKKFLVRLCPEVTLAGFNPQAFADEGIAVGRECLVSVTIQTQKKGERKGEKQNRIQDVETAASAGSFLG